MRIQKIWRANAAFFIYFFRGDYYSTVAYVTFFSKEKALYKACPNQVPVASP
jgi:hypothetical protein